MKAFPIWFNELKFIFKHNLGTEIEDTEQDYYKETFYDIGYTPEMVVQYLKDQ